MTTQDSCSNIQQLAAFLQRAEGATNDWLAFEDALGAVFGHQLFTVMVFNAERGRLRRLHSNRADVSPVGGAKAVSDSPWTRHVLREGRIYVGSNQADIRSVFSEHRTLASIGCHSVLNIPVRNRGVTIGTINLLDATGHYDGADQRVALVFAALATAPMMQALAGTSWEASDDAALERV
jgi:GAF domain-containing protein